MNTITMSSKRAVVYLQPSKNNTFIKYYPRKKYAQNNAHNHIPSIEYRFKKSDNSNSLRSRDLKTGRDKRHFLGEMHIKFFRRPPELQNKTLEKLQIYFVGMYVLLSNRYIHLLIHTY
jgi:hypothetical protein